MKCNRNKFFCAVLLYILLCSQVLAEAALTPDDEKTSRLKTTTRLAGQQFQQGEYSLAKTTFEQALALALKQGQPLQSIYYNLGSTCYKLEQYDESRSYFSHLLADKKLQAIVYYNLALIENKQGNKKNTIDYLNTGRQLASEPQLTALIDEQLLKLTPQKPTKTKPGTDKDWQAYAYLTGGYDSNINFAPLEVASDESGSFAQAIAIFDKVIVGEAMGAKQHALLFTSNIFLSNYFATDFNDYRLYDIGLRYLLPVNRWRNAIELNLKQSDYGHDDYQRIYASTLKTRRRFSGGDTLRLRYRYEQVNSINPLYDYLEGDRHRFRLGYRFKWPRDALQLWYELELNDRLNTLNRNYSPTRNSVRLRYDRKLNASNKVYAELEYRRSDYDPTPVQDRADDRSTAMLAYSNDLASDWQLLFKWRYRRNHSTDSVFSYERHVAMLTLRKTF